MNGGAEPQPNAAMPSTANGAADSHATKAHPRADGHEQSEYGLSPGLITHGQAVRRSRCPWYSAPAGQSGLLVERVENMGVLRLHGAPLDLQGGGQLTGFRREIMVKNDKLLDLGCLVTAALTSAMTG